MNREIAHRLTYIVVGIVMCVASRASADPFNLDDLTLIHVPFPNAFETSPQGISNSGKVVGNFTQFFDRTSRTVGFSYVNGVFSVIDVPGSVFTEALDINDAGQIVGRFFDGTTGFHGFLYDGGVFTSIDVPGARLCCGRDAGTIPSGINNAGEIVGSWVDRTFARGFLYLNGVFIDTNIQLPGKRDTAVSKINEAGQMVGYASDFGLVNSNEGFLYSGGVFTPIVVPGASGTSPLGVNRAGQIVGDFRGNPVVPLGFIESGGVFATDIFHPTDINDAGQVIGCCFPGTFDGFIGQLPPAVVPEPATCFLVGSGVFLILGRLRRGPVHRLDAQRNHVE